MKAAHDKAGYLHRDISFNNIMLESNGKAVLNDWDHAGKIEHSEGTPPKTFRTVRLSHSL